MKNSFSGDESKHWPESGKRRGNRRIFLKSLHRHRSTDQAGRSLQRDRPARSKSKLICKLIPSPTRPSSRRPYTHITPGPGTSTGCRFRPQQARHNERSRCSPITPVNLSVSRRSITQHRPCLITQPSFCPGQPGRQSGGGASAPG